MPRRDWRLGSAKDFERVRRTGRSWSHPLLILWVAPAESQQARPRIGVSVGRRIGGAVVRNRVRRRVMESVQREYDRIPAGWDLVLVARSGAAMATFSGLREAVCFLLGVAGLRRAE